MPDVLSFYKLLLQASSFPCSNGAAAFFSLVPSKNERLHLALDVLLPALQDEKVQLPQKILAAFLLHALFDSNDRKLFNDYLLRVFEIEQAAAVAYLTYQLSASSEVPNLPRERTADSQAENEQFVWVLWKILNGEGKDLSPYSPNNLSRIILPPHLRAPHLLLQNTQNLPASINDPSPPAPQTVYDPPLLERANVSPPLPSPESFTQYTQPGSSQARYASTFPQIASSFEQNVAANELPGVGSSSNGWSREPMPIFTPQDRQQMQIETLRRLEELSLHPQSNVSSTDKNPTPATMTPDKDHRREALLHALCAELPPENPSLPLDRNEAQKHLWNAKTIGHDNFNETPDQDAMNRSDTDIISPYGVNYGVRLPLTQQRQSSMTSPSPIMPHTPSQSFKTTNNDSTYQRRRLESPTSSSPSMSVSKPPPGPIARPRLATSPLREIFSKAAFPPAQFVDRTDPQYVPAEVHAQAIRVPTPSDHPQQKQASIQNGSSWKSQTQTPSPRRPVGVIGSGRPSSKSRSPVSPGAGERGPSPSFGVIGNGRPSRRSSSAKHRVVSTVTGMIPFSVEYGRQGRDEEAKVDFGVIGRPRNSTRDSGEPSEKDEAEGVIVEEQEARGASSSHSSGSDGARKSSPKTKSWQGASPADISGVPSQATLDPSVLPVKYPSKRSTSNVINDDTQDSASPSSLDRFPTSASSPPNAYSERNKSPNSTSPLAPATLNIEPRPESFDKERETLSRAIVLLLSARERVLTLSEQRFLTPHLPILTRPLSLLRPGDLHPLISNNPDIAAKLLVLLLDRDDEDAARIEQILSEASGKDLYRAASTREHIDATLPTSFGAVDAIQSAVQFIAGVGDSRSDSLALNKVSPFGGREAREGYLEALRRLPPTIQSFNLIGKLLRPTPSTLWEIPPESVSNHDTPEMRVAKLTTADVLSGFISGCVRWIEKAEDMERDGQVPDDRVAVSASNLSRFYSSLLKHGFVSIEVDTTEIMGFALQFSRLEEARSLYSILATARA